MKKTRKMKGGGLAMLSPALSLVQSLQSGQPEGMLRLTPLAMANGSLDKKKKAQGKVPKMAKGGKVRGDGVCQRGKTKGAMR